MQSPDQVEQTLFSEVIAPQGVNATNSATGLVETNRLNAEANLSDKVAFATLVGQPKFFRAGTIDATKVRGDRIITVNNTVDLNLMGYFASNTDYLLDLPAYFYRRVRYDIEVWFEMQGMKQLQGAMIGSVLPLPNANSTPYTDQMNPIELVINPMRINRTIIPFMSPSTTKYLLKWMPNYTTKPTCAKEDSFVDTYAPDPRLYLGNSVNFIVLDALRTADNVSDLPYYRIYYRLTNLEFGVYEPLRRYGKAQ